MRFLYKTYTGVFPLSLCLVIILTIINALRYHFEINQKHHKSYVVVEIIDCFDGNIQVCSANVMRHQEIETIEVEKIIEVGDIMYQTCAFSGYTIDAKYYCRDIDYGYPRYYETAIEDLYHEN